MSEVVHYKGKLIKEEKINGETLEQLCKRLLNHPDTLRSYYNSYAEMLEDEYYKHYIILGEDVFSISYQEIYACDDILELKECEEGFEFEIKYHNGGCGFSEAIDYAYERLMKERFNNE